MESKRGKAHLMRFLLAGLVFQTVITPVVSRSLKEFSDQKNHYYTPHSRTLQNPDKEPTSCSTPSNGGSSTPSHGAGSGYGSQTASHGSGCSCGSPSPSQGGGGSYGTQAPSHGSTGYYNLPPSSGGLPAIIPSTPSSLVESAVTPPGSRGGYTTPTSSHGSGGYYNSPPTPSSSGLPIIIPAPSFPVVESPVTPPRSGGGYGTPTPSHGSGGSYNSPPIRSNGYYNPSPSNGYHNIPPSSPTIDPPVTPTPTITPPSPSIHDPNSHPHFTGTCKYWKTHPEAILSILGYLGNISQLFGASCVLAFGRDLSLPEALANTRTDGIGALYREGSASLLNSLVDGRFPFTTEQVKGGFVAAITSDKAAATQAELFKQANEGRLEF